LKLKETVATGISGGRPAFRFSPELTVAGVAIIARDGELAGAVVSDGSNLAITYVTTAIASGGEYPIMAVSFHVAPDLADGTEATVRLNPSTWTIGGVPIASRADTATVTVGGSLAVTDVVPGQGWFPAGTIVSVHGVGFEGDMRVRLDGDRLDDVEVVSPNEMRFALAEGRNLAGAELRIDNKDTGEHVTYYSYLRGTPAAISQRTLLSRTRPIFSGVTRSQATFGPLAASPTSLVKYAGLALQNPNLDPVAIGLELQDADGRLVATSARSLDGGHFFVLEISELFDGQPPPTAGSVRVTATLPIEAFGLVVDERTRSVTPRLMTGAP
jgi:hypothetical protein